MDNMEQLKEIVNYKRHLSRLMGKDVPLRDAAHIWVRKYAKVWRLRHNSKIKSPSHQQLFI